MATIYRNWRHVFRISENLQCRWIESIENAENRQEFNKCKKKGIHDCNVSKSFHILNCGSLESIQIGAWSCNDFAGDSELKNLSQLQSIQIGTIGSDSFNVHHSLFVIRNIDR